MWNVVSEWMAFDCVSIWPNMVTDSLLTLLKNNGIKGQWPFQQLQWNLCKLSTEELKDHSRDEFIRKMLKYGLVVERGGFVCVEDLVRGFNLLPSISYVTFSEMYLTILLFGAWMMQHLKLTKHVSEMYRQKFIYYPGSKWISSTV